MRACRYRWQLIMGNVQTVIHSAVKVNKLKLQIIQEWQSLPPRDDRIRTSDEMIASEPAVERDVSMSLSMAIDHGQRPNSHSQRGQSQQTHAPNYPVRSSSCTPKLIWRKFFTSISLDSNLLLFVDKDVSKEEISQTRMA